MPWPSPSCLRASTSHTAQSADALVVDHGGQVRRDGKHNFNVKEVTFQESVDVADEDFEDALDSFDLGAPAPTASSPAASKTPQLMADVMAMPAPAAASKPAAPAPQPTPNRSLLSRLFSWLFGPT